jgi:hypothetical protein
MKKQICKKGRKQKERGLPALYCVKVERQEGKETVVMSKCSGQKSRVRRSR